MPLHRLSNDVRRPLSRKRARSLEKLGICGEPRRYIKIGSSGARIAATFCGICGAPIYSCAADDPKFVNLRLGGVTQRPQPPTKRQGFCTSAMPWAYDIRAVPKI
ncbi:MAG: GFA family protein [Bradyrhizobium sp.]